MTFKVRLSDIVTCLFLAVTVTLLASGSDYLGLLLLGWAFLTSVYFFKMLSSVHTQEKVNKAKPVNQLLGGLKQEKGSKSFLVRERLRLSSVGLLGVGVLSCLFLFWYEGTAAIETVGLITLCLLIFWHVQGAGQNEFNAGVYGTLFAIVFCLQIILYHGLNVDITAVLTLSFSKITILSCGLYLGAVFMRGLVIRHKNQIFPAAGLFMLIFCFVMLAQLELYTLPVITALLSICYAQSFSTYKLNHFTFMPGRRHYT